MGDLSILPAYQRIVELARRPNPLLMLRVEDRELSWSAFMAWLLDPAGPTADHAAAALRTMIQRQARECAPHPLAVPAIERLLAGEARAAVVQRERAVKGGRLDLEVEFSSPGGRVRLLLENKIGAAESPKQLLRYVDQASGGLSKGTLLLPILLALGDEPPSRSSCDWAVVLHRRHARAWLSDLVARAASVGEAPPLAAAYLEAFELWDSARELREVHWEAIEAAARLRPDGWPLVAHRLVEVDRGFFAAVLSDPAFRRCLDGNGLREVPFRSALNRAYRFNFGRATWQVHKPEYSEKGFAVHYETSGRGALFVHVEISPYEGGIDRKAHRKAALQRQLASKQRVLESLRSRLLRLDPTLGASEHGLGQVHKSGTLAAVRFSAAHAAKSPSACAAFYQRVVEATMGIVDEEVEAERVRLRTAGGG